jgi:hypothetical protein
MVQRSSAMHMSVLSKIVALATLGLAASMISSASCAESDPPNAPAAPYSCFAPLDSCLRNFARTGDREYYELCMVSERICRAYRRNGKLIRPLKDDSILSDCFPVVSVGDLLRLCKSQQDWERASCRQTVLAGVAEAGLDRKSSRPRTKGQRQGMCTRAASMSDDEYVRAFVEWLEKHPSKQQLPVAEGLAAAVAASFPCRGVKARRRRLH